MDPELFFGLSATISLIIITAASWVVMRSHKTISSKLLFASLSMQLLLVLISEPLRALVFTRFSYISYPRIDFAHVATLVRLGGPSVLLVISAVSFYFVARNSHPRKAT